MKAGKWLLIGLGVFIVLGVGGCLAEDEGDSQVITDTDPPPAPAPAPPPAVTSDPSTLTCGEWNALPQNEQIRMLHAHSDTHHSLTSLPTH